MRIRTTSREVRTDRVRLSSRGDSESRFVTPEFPVFNFFGSPALTKTTLTPSLIFITPVVASAKRSWVSPLGAGPCLFTEGEAR